MTIQQLEYVVALDNERNFVRAAQRTFVTQPTLTMQLRKLEDETGFQIFNRSKKPISPTILGVRFIEKARQIIREINELKAMVSHETESVQGKFRIGIIPTMAPYLLPRFLPGFIQEHPETKLGIEEIQSETVISGLKNDLIDVGIMATPVYEKQLREIPLFNEPFLALFPGGDAHLSETLIDPDDLLTDQLLLLSEGHCFRNQTLNICKTDEEKHPRSFDYHSGSIETLKELVMKGIGYTLVPELSVTNEMDSNKNLRRFKTPVPSREVSLVVHRSFSKERFIEVLRDSILKNIPAHFSKNKGFFRVKWR